MGFVLLNLTFILNWGFQKLVDLIVGIFISGNANQGIAWYSMAKHGAFALLILYLSWRIMRLKIGVLAKSTFLIIPTAVVLVTMGILLYQWPIIMYSTGTALTLLSLFIINRTRQSWHYYYAVIIVAATLLAGALKGVQI